MSASLTMEDVIKARSTLMGVAEGLDGKRLDSWSQYGYKTQVEFAELYKTYERYPGAFSAVHKLLDWCWKEKPRVKPDDDTDDVKPWEVKTRKAVRKAWVALKEVDRRNMIGRFAGAIMRVDDNATDLSIPMARAKALVELVPLWENELRVKSRIKKKGNPDYGKVEMYEYLAASPEALDSVQAGTMQNTSGDWIQVHASRVIVMAEGGTTTKLKDGHPLFLAGLNRLTDMEKILGGCGEGYFKNSSRGMVFEFDKDADVVQAVRTGSSLADFHQADENVADVLEEQAKAMNRSHDASVVLQGAKAYTVQTTLQDPTGAWTTAANEFAASVRIPFTILFGQQTGRLASDEDRSEMAMRCGSRQESDLTPLLEDMIRKLQAGGVVEAGEFVVEWPDMMAPSEEERFANMGKLAEVISKIYNVNAIPPFDENELRRVGGYGPRPKDQQVPVEGPASLFEKDEEEDEGDADPKPGEKKPKAGDEEKPAGR